MCGISRCSILSANPMIIFFFKRKPGDKGLISKLEINISFKKEKQKKNQHTSVTLKANLP